MAERDAPSPRHARNILIDAKASRLMDLKPRRATRAKVMPTIEVTPETVIDQSELGFSFARASGPGGMRRNKAPQKFAGRLSHVP
jgi:hypothetical protein